jgi:hypothetical protein
MIGGFSESSAVEAGNIWLDDFQIELSSAPKELPTIINGDFATDADGWKANYVDNAGGWYATFPENSFNGMFIINAGGQTDFDPSLEQTFTGLKIGSSYTVRGNFQSAYTGFGTPTANSFAVEIVGLAIKEYQRPAGAGEFELTFTATSTAHVLRLTAERNGDDSSYAVDNIAIRLGGTTATAPQIAVQPQGQTVIAGSAVTFSVSATGTEPLSYQWQKNGQNIESATGVSYTIDSPKLTDAGDYTVVVSNSQGSKTSEVAGLVVNPPPPHLKLAMYAGITVEGQLGSTYHIEYREAFDAENAWKLVATVTLTEATYFYLDKDSPNHPKRFYRVAD